MKWKKIASSLMMAISLMAVSLYSLAQTPPPINNVLLAPIKKEIREAQKQAKAAEANARAATQAEKPWPINDDFKNYPFGGATFTDPLAITENKQIAQTAMQGGNYKTALDAYRKITQQYKAIQDQVSVYINFIKEFDELQKLKKEQNGKEMVRQYRCLPCKDAISVPTFPAAAAKEMYLIHGWDSSPTYALALNKPDPDSIEKLTALFNEVIAEYKAIIDRGQKFKNDYEACQKEELNEYDMQRLQAGGIVCR